MNNNNPEAKIYLTAKTRMVSEARMRSSAKTYHVLISWYSFCLIVFSIAQISEIVFFRFSDVYFAGCSVAIFGMSLFVFGEKLYERAEQFRNCYLELQDLYNSGSSTAAKMRKYALILEKYENQKGDHYDDMLFDAWLRNQKLQNANGDVSIEPISGLIVVIKRISRYLFTAALFLAPVISGYALSDLLDEGSETVILEKYQSNEER